MGNAIRVKPKPGETVFGGRGLIFSAFNPLQTAPLQDVTTASPGPSEVTSDPELEAMRLDAKISGIELNPSTENQSPEPSL